MSTSLSSSSFAPAPVGTETTSTGGPTTNPNVTPVTVSLRVNLDVSGVVELFGYPADEAVNPVVCSGKIDPASLTDLFVYWQPDSSSQVSGKLNDASAGVIEARAISCASDFQVVINSSMDASGANPFIPYAGDLQGNSTYATFGDLALGYAAEKLFGHPQAVAAIDNDQDIVSYFNSNGAGAMQMAELLKAALQLISREDATAIAASVIGQDAERASGQGDNKSEADAKPLRFYADDTVFIRVIMQEWGITVNNNTNQQSALSDYSTGTQSFDLVIKLGSNNVGPGGGGGGAQPL